MREDITNWGYINNEPTDVGLGIKPKSTTTTN